jgi:ubiquinone/menaquinone biosynthesis C-methylase UbiE
MKIFHPKDHIEIYEILASECSDDWILNQRSKEDTRLVIEDILLHMDFSTPCKVLDVGPGNGWMVSWLPDREVVYWGIDPAPTLVKRLQQKFADLPYVHIKEGRSDNLPNDAAGFDRVICHGVFPCLLGKDAFGSTLREFWRVTKPRAKLWLGECPFRDEIAYLGSPRVRLWRFARKLYRKVIFSKYQTRITNRIKFDRVLPTFYLPVDVVRKHAEDIGWEVEVFPCVGTNFFPKTRVNYLLKRDD